MCTYKHIGGRCTHLQRAGAREQRLELGDRHGVGVMTALRHGDVEAAVRRRHPEVHHLRRSVNRGLHRAAAPDRAASRTTHSAAFVVRAQTPRVFLQVETMRTFTVAATVALAGVVAANGVFKGPAGGYMSWKTKCVGFTFVQANNCE
jgi:hypothetical protein